ncbi:HisA/HisF-related TIM barrel protein [Methyloglobulus sp.]|uniref:HisA/HisF-related TIM barrel protein n=1 Tax=Methyloglobulus sp. TaxID=2518622 RepID=UPI001798E228|nr:nickel transporter [Methyloglobulus sp.]
MQVIPVIDLKNGLVVHAKQGNRDDYAALKSELCKSSDIFDVVDAFRTLFRSPTIYIADLNAITRQGNNGALLATVLASFPNITFWIDGGYPLCNDNLIKFDNFMPVLGSESFHDENVSDIKKFNQNFILSLDYSSTGELGAKTLFSEQELWPENIIIMSLPKVGSNQGPDLDRLSTYRKQYRQRNIIAAGGIRDSEDLRTLEQIGIETALVATALHNGKISPDEIATNRQKNTPQAGYF